MTATAVLVHGAWHGAWCFDRVLPLLTRAGVPARALDLPGHGTDPAPLGDLHADAARVRAVLDEVAGPVVLLGHSYGGAVVTEAGTHPAVRHLVYLCAAVPAEGETLADLLAEQAEVDDGRPRVSDGLDLREDGTMVLSDEVAAATLYNDCDPATVRWALERLTPQPAITFSQAPAHVAWRERPSTYVLCTEDRIIHPDAQAEMARHCGVRVDWPTGHSPFLSAPDRVADLLAGLARPLS